MAIKIEVCFLPYAYCNCQDPQHPNLSKAEYTGPPLNSEQMKCVLYGFYDGAI